MNERIRELAKQADEICNSNGVSPENGLLTSILAHEIHEWSEVFAELIIQECASYFDQVAKKSKEEPLPEYIDDPEETETYRVMINGMILAWDSAGQMLLDEFLGN